MKRSIIPSALIAAALLLGASLSLAAENKAGPATETKAIGNAKTTEKGAKAKAGKAAAKVKLVDINSAGKAELKTLPGVDDAKPIRSSPAGLTSARLICLRKRPYRRGSTRRSGHG